MADDAGGDAMPLAPCPICGKPARPVFRPFCSKRCADVDLQRWFSGAYALPVREGEGRDPDDEEP